MEKQKCPEVRFKGFQQPWQTIRLGDVTNCYSGGTPSIGIKSFYGGDIPFIRSGEINSNRTELYLTEEGLAKSSAKLVKEGNLLYALYGATSGEVSLSLINGAINQAILAIIPKDSIESIFLSSWFRKSKGKILTNYLQGGQGNLSGEIVKNLIVDIPSASEEIEQIKIGTFFQNLDQSLALHKKKLIQTQNFKKAMLEKMFPKHGSKRPEIRLKGFSGDWEAFTLGSLCHIGDIDHRMPDSREQGIPYLMTGDFIGINELDFKNAKRISNEDYEQLAKKIKPEAGDILFARYASVGTVRYIKTHLKFLISYSCAILKTSVNSNGEYLCYYLQTKCSQNQIEQEINTGSQRNIGIDSLKKLSILMPKDYEQRVIADFFRKIDENLVLQEKQLQTLKNLKQALLEKMFV